MSEETAPSPPIKEEPGLNGWRRARELLKAARDMLAAEGIDTFEIDYAIAGLNNYEELTTEP